MNQIEHVEFEVSALTVSDENVDKTTVRVTGTTRMPFQPYDHKLKAALALLSSMGTVDDLDAAQAADYNASLMELRQVINHLKPQ